VEKRTTLLLVRFRYHIVTRRGTAEMPLLAEDCRLMAFRGLPSNAEWLDDQTADSLLSAPASGNVSPDAARHHLAKILEQADRLTPRLESAAEQIGQQLLEAHRRVRSAAGLKGISYSVEPKLPADVLGTFLYLPAS
jgi:hypothetical protein